MNNMIVSSNQIRTRRYNLVIDGDIVEEFLSPRMATILLKEYRSEGYKVDKIEVFTLTNSAEIVGDNMKDVAPMKYPKKELSTPTVTERKAQEYRNKILSKGSRKTSKRVITHYSSYGQSESSLMHQDYLNLLRKDGYRVFNLLNGEVWIGLQSEISNRIFNYIKNGGRKSDLDIKFIGKAA